MRHANMTLVESLRRRADREPERIVYRFLEDGEVERASRTYAELDERARAIARAIALHARPGEVALLLHSVGLEFLDALFGCFYAGVIAVPVQAPASLRKTSVRREELIARDTNARLVLATSGMSSPQISSGQTLILTDTISDGLDASWKGPSVAPTDVAFLQYTSGSTGAPRGVVVRHSNLVDNLGHFARVSGIESGETVVSWLPLYHDMGLIGAALECVYAGWHGVLMRPDDFLRRPIRWLRAIDRYQGVIAGAPNFAYELCARRIAEAHRAELDLSSWRVASNGAEPVRADTMKRFSEAFASCGFRGEAFMPCYGLAEATLFVSGRGDRSTYRELCLDQEALEAGCARIVEGSVARARTIVSCGPPLENERVVIVDRDTCEPREAGVVGEIWVRGASVATGYWNREEESRATFSAHLANGEGPFLRTGDLGFLHEGELYVTGRHKDVLVIHGACHYPQDIEYTVEQAHAALRSGCVAAFAIEVDDEERVALVAEIARSSQVDADDVATRIRDAVAALHGISVHTVLFVEPGNIPKTSSGKIRRHACKTGLEHGTFDEIARSIL